MSVNSSIHHKNLVTLSTTQQHRHSARIFSFCTTIFRKENSLPKDLLGANYLLSRKSSFADWRCIKPCFQVFSILTAAFSLKIPFTKKQDDLKTGYTPIGARSLDELQAFRQYFDGLDPVLLFVVVTAKDGKSLNLLTHLNATVAIVDHVGKTFAMKGRTYYDICKNFCDANEPVLQYRVSCLKYFVKTTVVFFSWQDVNSWILWRDVNSWTDWKIFHLSTIAETSALLDHKASTVARKRPHSTNNKRLPRSYNTCSNLCVLLIF